MVTSDPYLLRITESGLYCPAGDFYIDPWRAVRRAVVTHGHSDHARTGSNSYLAAEPGKFILQSRLGPDAQIETLPYGEATTINGVKVSLHPAGHILGSAQVRVEYRGDVWVVSGDYKTEFDPTCTPFEPIRCHTFITESTFGLPIYRWPPQQETFAAINAWWRANQEMKRASLLFGYTLGKAQRLIAGVDSTIGPILTHGSVEQTIRDYRKSGVMLPETTYASAAPRSDWSRALIVAPPSAHQSPWARKFGSASTAFASGWMRIRGVRRRRAIDRGFVLSDHVDWPGLMGAIKATGAERIWVTHGYTAVVVRWLQEQGYEARALQTRYQNDEQEDANDVAAADDS